MYLHLPQSTELAFNVSYQYPGNDELNFIARYINIDSIETFVLNSTSPQPFTEPNRLKAIVNLHRVNDIRYLNKYFENINAHLEFENLFCGCFENVASRKKRLAVYKIPIIGFLYKLIEFLLFRVWPKITGLNKLYFIITKGKNRVLTETEVLGRLVCCGFQILNFKTIHGLTYFIAKKVKEPTIDLHPSYGPICKLQRVGKQGKVIGVYKFRTMHPYAEYLQDYILKRNGYSPIGKPAQDFRLTSWGKFMRKYWLDELPQLINVLKGEMGLVGVRPISKRFLAEYPEDLKLKRFKYKPGCVPPYVALLKQDVNQYLDSERIYLDEKERHPVSTDIKFFVKAVSNIITHKIKSA